MRKVLIACIVGALLLGALLVVRSATGKGAGKSTEVWWYEGNETLIKAAFQTTATGIVQQSRYEPKNLKLTFKPIDRFAEPKQGDHHLWTYKPADYTIDQASPAQLSSIFTAGAQYWLEITPQD